LEQELLRQFCIHFINPLFAPNLLCGVVVIFYQDGRYVVVAVAGDAASLLVVAVTGLACVRLGYTVFLAFGAPFVNHAAVVDVCGHLYCFAACPEVEVALICR